MGVIKAFSVVDRPDVRTHSESSATVQVFETPKQSWKETTKVTAVSRSGAGFSLSRKCTVGRLVSVSMPLSPELRAYSYESAMYAVKAIVQYCNEGEIDGKKVYHVGVGFIGKEMPKSFKTDHMQNYRIVGMAKDGMWEITEVKTQFKTRKKPRYWMALKVRISLIEKEKKSVRKEDTVTVNICADGVSVASYLGAKAGDTLKFACKALDFYAMAIVRNRNEKGKEIPTLHLEFVEAKFPIERLIQARTLLAA